MGEAMAKTPLEAIVHQIVDDSLMFADVASPFKAASFAGDGRLCVIVGENASGKSLFYRLIAQFAHKHHKLLPITISIRERTGAGAHEMGGMRRIMMFGDESEQSTGATSVNVVASGFHNAGRDTPALLLLDEPEMGLSDGYARALGQFIANEYAKLPDTCAGVVIVTHSRALVDGLWSQHATRPLFVHLGDDPKPLERWLAEPEVRSVEDLMNLRELALQRRRAVHRLLHPEKASVDGA
jgi:ABC-type sulfate/molybdate transport systems ATPase subunit